VISTIDNFLRPKLISNQTKLHELLVLFSVLGGISVFGLLGIVLGPVVLAITLGLLETFRSDKPFSIAD
jgi:predicted PurR-regulated permease PerM